MTVKVEDFRDVVEDSGIFGDYHGEYRGRFFHTGFAVSVESMSELGKLQVALSKDPRTESLSEVSPHWDQLGLGYIASWPDYLFDESVE